MSALGGNFSQLSFHFPLSCKNGGLGQVIVLPSSSSFALRYDINTESLAVVLPLPQQWKDLTPVREDLGFLIYPPAAGFSDPLS